MKKIIAFTLIALLLVAFAACANDSDSDTSSAESQASVESTEDLVITLDYLSEEIDDCVEYTDDIGSETLVIAANKTVSNFRFVAIEWEIDEDGIGRSNPQIKEVLYTVDELAMPFVAINTKIPEHIKSDRGFVYTDENGDEKCFYIFYSGLDGLNYDSFEVVG